MPQLQFALCSVAEQPFYNLRLTAAVFWVTSFGSNIVSSSALLTHSHSSNYESALASGLAVRGIRPACCLRCRYLASDNCEAQARHPESEHQDYCHNRD